MIIRNVLEVPPNKYGHAVFCGVLAIHIQRKDKIDSYSFSCLKKSYAEALNCLNADLVTWMKSKLDNYVSQREKAIQASETLTNVHINAIYHLRDKPLKRSDMISFCESFLNHWEYVELLMPHPDSRFAHWRTVMKQLFHTCTREIQPTLTQSIQSNETTTNN
jgi:hypothetical protein